ncbi:MAG: right-handed parallel beta-helix repeat-containing protein [Promethearchaeota archaeon]
MKQLSLVLVLLVLVLGLNNWIIKPKIQINDKGFVPNTLRNQSKFISASIQDPPAAFLTGTYSDRGVDIDGDGKFNQLVIDVEINVTSTGSYSLYLEINSTKNDITFSGGSWEYCNVGIQILSVSIHVDVGLIYCYRVNTSYVVDYIRLENSDHNILDWVYTPHTTRIYNYTEFDPPTAFLTGTYSDRGVDTDGDGKFNQLVIDIEINVTSAGSYYLDLELSSTNGNITLYGESWEYCNVGIHTMSVSIHVKVGLIYYYRLNTSYVVDYITFEDWTRFNILGRIYTPHTTRIYNYTEFNPPVAFLTGTYSDRGVDTDGDGKFNKLVIDVEINVISADFYNLDLELSSTNGDITLLGGNEEYYNVGTHIVSVFINVTFSTVYSHQLNTSYVIAWARLYWDRNPIFEVSTPYTTRVYNYTEFDLNLALLTGNYYDYGVDLDADGRFDELVIDVEIDFIEAGRYTVEINLGNINLGTQFHEVTSSYWTEGIKNVSLSIDAYILYPSIPSSSQYILEIINIYDENNNLRDQSYHYSTLSHYYTEFDIHQITINGNNNFSTLIRDENWPGDGTSSNPYVIEGLTLNGPNSIALISIWNTDAYFIINNCTLNGGAIGILLTNVTNAYISNSLIQNNNRGIYLNLSNNNLIADNTITINKYGILLGSDLLHLPPSTVNNNTIINNTIYNNVESGVWMSFESSSNLVKWNDFKDNGQTIEYQANDSGVDNIFSFNYWYDWTKNEPYPILGQSGNYDLNPLTDPHHLSKPRILFPNWGETLTNTIIIDWIPATDDLGHELTYSVYYSSDNGSSWKLLGTELSTTSFRWDVRNVSAGSTFLVKVIAWDAFGFFTMDISDQPFTIQTPRQEQPPSTLPFRLVLLLLLGSFLFIIIQKKAK